MKQNLITDVVQEMLPYLNNAQTEKLQEVLQHTLFGYEVTTVEPDTENLEQDLVELLKILEWVVVQELEKWKCIVVENLM